MSKVKTLADVTTSAANRPRLQMSDSEILSNYNSAKDKKAQIGVLADLNVTNKDVIRAILIENGYILDAAQKDEPPVKNMARMPWTDEEDAELLRLKQMGRSYIEISEKLGRSADTVRWRYGVLRKKQAGEANPAPRKSTTISKDFDAAISQPKAVPVVPDPTPSRLDMLPKIRYALTLCCDASNAFGNDRLFYGGVALGELKQVLSTLKFELEKENSR